MDRVKKSVSVLPFVLLTCWLGKHAQTPLYVNEFKDINKLFHNVSTMQLIKMRCEIWKSPGACFRTAGQESPLIS